MSAKIDLLKKNKLIYIAGFNRSVFKSQVLSYLDWVYEQKYFDEIYLLVGTPLDSIFKNNHIKKEYSVLEFWDLPGYDIFNWPLYFTLSRALKKIDTDHSIIHIRSEQYSKFVHQYRIRYNKSCKIVTDIRGAVPEETFHYKNMSFLQKSLKKKYFSNQRKHLKNHTDIVSAVSSHLKDYINEYFRFDKERIFVNHSFASKYFYYDEEYRKEYREKLNIGSDEIVFIFSTGGNSSWQNTEQIINSINQSGYRIINLSNKKIQGKNVINLYVPHEEVPKYLCAADIGVIWRDEDIVNNVASPVKFSEYVCCGLPIITNTSVRLISSYIQEIGYGKLINSIDDLRKPLIDELLKLNREKISEYSLNRFHITGVIRGYLKMYSDLV